MIVLGRTTQEKLVDFVLASKPRRSLVQRKSAVENLLLWRQFRRDVLAMYAIPFKRYSERVRYYREVFGD